MAKAEDTNNKRASTAGMTAGENLRMMFSWWYGSRSRRKALPRHPSGGTGDDFSRIRGTGSRLQVANTWCNAPRTARRCHLHSTIFEPGEAVRLKTESFPPVAFCFPSYSRVGGVVVGQAEFLEKVRLQQAAQQNRVFLMHGREQPRNHGTLTGGEFRRGE